MCRQLVRGRAVIKIRDNVSFLSMLLVFLSPVDQRYMMDMVALKAVVSNVPHGHNHDENHKNIFSVMIQDDDTRYLTFVNKGVAGELK